MIAVRAILFQTLFYSWAALLAFAYLPTLLLPRAAIVAGTRFWSWSSLLLLRVVVGLRYRVEGLENLPEGRFVVASKHQSAWDTIVLPVIFPGPVVILKKELLRIPLYGWYARKHGMIGIDRKAGASALRAMVSDAAEATARGQPLIMFPEGTRTVPGERRPYQRGIAGLYGRLNLPVVPMALNSGLFWGRRDAFIQPGLITVRILPPIPPGMPPGEFMARLEDAIETESAALLDTPDH